MMNDEKMYTPSDVANRLQVNERTVTQWLRKGLLRGYKIRKKWRVSAKDFNTFLEAGANTASNKTQPGDLKLFSHRLEPL